MTAFLGVISAAALALGELGGYVFDQSGRPLEGDVSVVLHTDSATVSGARVKPNGKFLVQAPPGDYWAQVLANGEEVHAEKVTVPAGSVMRRIRVVSPEGPSALGVGGSGSSVGAMQFRPLSYPGVPTWLQQLLRDDRRPTPLLNAP